MSNDYHLLVLVLVLVVDVVLGTGIPAIPQEIFKCVSSVACVVLQDLANQANQISVRIELDPSKYL
jgi:TRAP-type uncharacterized transport system fused permease subunit